MIEAIVHGFANVGKPATFAVTIFDDTGNKHERIVPLISTKSAYTAELAAIKYVCQSLADKDCNLTVKTSVPHIAKLFQKTEDGDWVPQRKNKNLNLINEARALSEDFKSFACEVLKKDAEAMQYVRGLAKKPVRS